MNAYMQLKKTYALHCMGRYIGDFEIVSEWHGLIELDGDKVMNSTLILLTGILSVNVISPIRFVKILVLTTP